MRIEGRIAALERAGDRPRWTITVSVSAAFQSRIEPVALRVLRQVEPEAGER
jgi:hypothetical protein